METTALHLASTKRVKRSRPKQPLELRHQDETLRSHIAYLFSVEATFDELSHSQSEAIKVQHSIDSGGRSQSRTMPAYFRLTLKPQTHPRVLSISGVSGTPDIMQGTLYAEVYYTQ